MVREGKVGRRYVQAKVCIGGDDVGADKTRLVRVGCIELDWAPG